MVKNKEFKFNKIINANKSQSMALKNIQKDIEEMKIDANDIMHELKQKCIKSV